MNLGEIACRLGFHKWRKNVTCGFGSHIKQDILYTCKRKGCDAEKREYK